MPVKNRLACSVSLVPSQAKALAALFLCLCFFVFPASPTLAQYGGGGYPGSGGWQISYQTNGTANLGMTSTTQDWGNTPDYSGYVGGRGGHDSVSPSNPTSKADSNGSVTIVADWVGGGTPDGKVYVLIESSAEATGGSEVVPAILDANNGFGDPFSPNTSSDKKMYGLHLVQKDNAAHAAHVVVKTVTLSASCTLPTSRTESTGAIAWCKLRAFKDDRGVTITSDIEDSYYKPGTLNTGGIKCPRDDDGSMMVESAVYQDFWSSGGTPHYYGPWKGTVSFTGHPAGFFENSEFVWNFGGQTEDHAFEALNGAWYLLPQQESYLVTNKTFLFGSGGSSQRLGQSTTTSLKVHDSNDGAIAENRYTINWHYPYESWYKASTNPPYWQPTEPVSVDPGTSSAGVAHGTWQWDHFYYDWQKMWMGVLPDLTPGPVWAGLIHIADLEVPKPKTTDYYVNMSLVWGDATATGNNEFTQYSDFDVPPASSGTSEMDFYDFSPILLVQYQIEFWKGDAYDHHGYSGVASELINRYTGRIHFAGHFKRHTNPPGGGGPTP